jgi:hypothetical protein
LLSGERGEDDIAPLLPFIIMDCAQLEFSREVVPIGARQNAKMLIKAWQADYRMFNQRLFRTLDAEQRDFVIDMMDAYEDFIANEMMLMRVAIMDLVKECSFDAQKTVASLMLCNIFSQVAQITWGEIFYTKSGHHEVCAELERIRNRSHKLTNMVCFIKDDVNPNTSTRLHDAIQSYISKTTKWLKTYNNE